MTRDKEGMAMTPQAFRAWRKERGWKQKEAADRLGLKKRMIQYYEKGDRNGKSVRIPKTVRLACYALAHGVSDFDGDHIQSLPHDSGPPDDGGGTAVPEAAES